MSRNTWNRERPARVSRAVQRASSRMNRDSMLVRLWRAPAKGGGITITQRGAGKGSCSEASQKAHCSSSGCPNQVNLHSDTAERPSMPISKYMLHVQKASPPCASHADRQAGLPHACLCQYRIQRTIWCIIYRDMPTIVHKVSI